jgi:2-polyprenyl-3-methyl-5-hydroxy-6-metoxy-1,4-benzoquinol methylase
MIQKLTRKLLRSVANHDPSYYDMYQDGNESWFARLYLERIAHHARVAGIQPPATGVPSIVDRRPTLLEAGCQTGRLAIPLARQGFEVTGIDTSGFALRRARGHASSAGVKASFVRGDLIDVLRRRPAGEFDIAVCAEVVYLSPQYRQMLSALARAIRPGGLLFVSHRPRFYYLLEALRQYDIATAAEVCRRSEGAFRESRYYNWQTEEELRSLYGSAGLQWVALHPIDHLAWLSGLDLQQLTPEQRDRWLELELRCSSEAVGTCARYVLVVASKPNGKAP